MKISQGLSPVARGLPMFAAMHLCGFMALTTSACVFPIPGGESNEDAGLNASPVILHSNPPMPFELGGPIVLAAEPDPTNPVTFTIDVYDANVEDKLWIRVFRDYDGVPPTVPPNPFFVAQRTAIANDMTLGEPLRAGIEIDTVNFCLNADRGRNIVFDVVVADRQFSDGGNPINRATAGQWSVRSWIGVCQ